MMKQAQAMQAKMADAQAELESLIVDGESGGGLVKLTLSAKGALQSIAVDPSLLKPSLRTRRRAPRPTRPWPKK